MNILQVTKYFYPAISFGGPIQCTYNLSKYLVKRGHKVTVYATDALDISSNVRVKEKYQLINGAEVYYFRNVAKFYGLFINPDIICALRNTISDFDVVHLHEYRTFQNIAFYYINKSKVPYVLSCHGEFTYKEEPWDWFLLRRLFEHTFGRKLINDADRLIALTQFEATQYLNGGVKRDKIVVIPNGIAPEDFSDIPPTGSFKASYGIKDEQIILYLGRINKFKGIDTLVKAFAHLSKNRNDVKLVLAGSDDGFLGTLKNIVNELHLMDKVLFTGCLAHKQRLAAYNDAAVVVYPSLHEGFPIVPLEAGIMGKPVIVSDVPAMDFVRKGRFGLTVKHGNVIQLKEALERMLNDPELLRELGTNGKKFVKENYCWESVAKRIEDTYCSVLK